MLKKLHACVCVRCTGFKEWFCSGARNVCPIEKSFAQQEKIIREKTDYSFNSREHKIKNIFFLLNECIIQAFEVITV